jgi:hypothetical protein
MTTLLATLPYATVVQHESTFDVLTLNGGLFGLTRSDLASLHAALEYAQIELEWGPNAWGLDNNLVACPKQATCRVTVCTHREPHTPTRICQGCSIHVAKCVPVC